LLLQVYTVGSGKTMPAWLSEAKKRALRKDEDYRWAQGAARKGLDAAVAAGSCPHQHLEPRDATGAE
jgi:hypothetical protein